MIYLTDDGKKLFNNEKVRGGDVICKSLLYVFFTAVCKDAYLDTDFEDRDENYYLNFSNRIKKLHDLTQKHEKYILHLMENDRRPLDIAIAVCNAKYISDYEMLIYKREDGAEAIAIQLKNNLTQV